MKKLLLALILIGGIAYGQTSIVQQVTIDKVIVGWKAESNVQSTTGVLRELIAVDDGGAKLALSDGATQGWFVFSPDQKNELVLTDTGSDLQNGTNLIAAVTYAETLTAETAIILQAGTYDLGAAAVDITTTNLVYLKAETVEQFLFPNYRGCSTNDLNPQVTVVSSATAVIGGSSTVAARFSGIRFEGGIENGSAYLDYTDCYFKNAVDPDGDLCRNNYIRCYFETGIAQDSQVIMGRYDTCYILGDYSMGGRDGFGDANFGFVDVINSTCIGNNMMGALTNAVSESTNANIENSIIQSDYCLSAGAAGSGATADVLHVRNSEIIGTKVLSGMAALVDGDITIEKSVIRGTNAMLDFNSSDWPVVLYCSYSEIPSTLDLVAGTVHVNYCHDETATAIANQ